MGGYGAGPFGSGAFGSGVGSGYGDGPFGSGAYGGGVSAPTRITWGDPQDRGFETGLDRGVLYLNNGVSVPWNGLLSVDEVGGDDSTAYYMDGRPFLYVPKPKEFAATLEAYTYPDEFASVMGVEEIADGLYVDSQQLDSFHICYRTLIGSAANTDMPAYKIHLIYNATINSPAYTYQTVGSELEPITFSWDIKAVPVTIENRRPSAHLIFDSRKMASEDLRTVEDMLYSGGAVPTPQELYDTLYYGDEVTFVDNGDGTWTAEGSYKYIKMLSETNFSISNINAIFHGDGTYTINPTGGIDEPLGPIV